jgi:quercetin dioxygenase-like cupin family protein
MKSMSHAMRTASTKTWWAAVALASSALVAVPAFACPTHSVSLPTRAGPGQGKEVKELLDTPFVKLVTITLHGGTVLTEHAAPVAVTIQALSGSGVVRTGDKSERVAVGQLLLIAPNALHEVTPDGKSDLVLLVHYLKSAPSAESDKPHEHGH